MNELSLDPVLLERVERLVRVTDTSVVISSAWRNIYKLDHLRRMLQDYVPEHKVIDRTPNLKTRGEEIQAWLHEHGHDVYHVAILDDNDYGMFDMGPMRPWLVQTNPKYGVQGHDIKRAERLLMRGPRWVRKHSIREEKAS